jgi:sulfur-oxidizing protein SoxX
MTYCRVGVLCALILAGGAAIAQEPGATAESIAVDTLSQGKAAAFDRRRGNCLACHAMDDGEMAGAVGPPLIMMRQRFSERAALRRQIWDATERNPNSVMPPFGRHGMLTEEEIDWIVDYLYTL